MQGVLLQASVACLDMAELTLNGGSTFALMLDSSCPCKVGIGLSRSSALHLLRFIRRVPLHAFGQNSQQGFFGELVCFKQVAKGMRSVKSPLKRGVSEFLCKRVGR